MFAQEAFDPGSVPHVPVAQDENGIIAGPPAEPAQQDGIKQAHMIAGEQVSPVWIESIEAGDLACIRQAEKCVSAKAKQRPGGCTTTICATSR